MVNQRTLQQLRSLGYAAGAQPEYTLTGQGIDPKDRLEVLKLLYFAVSPDARTPASRRVSLLRRALAQDPTNPTIYFHLGDEYQRTRRHREALKLYQDAVRNGIAAAWLHSRLAHLLLRQGNRDEAIASYEKAAKLNPGDCDSLNDLGLTYLDAGRPADAEEAFRRCLAAGEEHALTYNGLGLVSVRKRDWSAALGHFEKAAQLDPDLPEAYLNLGRIYRMIGADTRARACFEAFLAKASPAQYGEVIPKVKAELDAMRLRD